MADNSTEIDKETLRLLTQGRLPWDDVKNLLRSPDKGKRRFFTYVEICQERVPWKDKILLPLTDHLYIVRTENGQRIVKCDCGHEFGDYRVNWKFRSNIYVRKTTDEFREVYTVDPCLIDPDLVEMREFYCPDCLALLAVENVPPGYPPLFDMFPDLDTFYGEWLGSPLEDESTEWFHDRTPDELSRWASDQRYGNEGAQ